MNFFSNDQASGKVTREDRRCRRCDADSLGPADTIRVPEGVSACSNAVLQTHLERLRASLTGPRVCTQNRPLAGKLR